MTEGLRPTLVQRNHVASQPTHITVGAGVEARPYGVWGGGRAEPTSLVNQQRRTEDGAPYGV